ncbi:Peroxisomal biogenesis factor 11 [Trypanosoma melophagium]|uniref:Peroxisomal biogenesis factor 11 n=1 Tax=Trypanosoma melophagium TaxID=715481 RepID=UPI003519FA97|nr:Peroxisomal biogenesis factor 11 [Trypanosoma melophagium]
MQNETLRVLGSNPFEDITAKTRLRQLLQTHQGRDKLFKVVQYFLRVKLWMSSVNYNLDYVPGAEFTAVERNLMTIVNTRRLFRVGRFVGEFVRMRLTLIKCSELVYIPVNGGQWIALFIQCQMICDMIARALMCVKSLCEDFAFLAQKGFFNSQVSDQLISLAVRCTLPVLLIDLFLNTLRLLQGMLDASRQPTETEFLLSKDSFSLLSRYDRVDKLRRRMTKPNPVNKTKEKKNESQIVEEKEEEGETNDVLVSSYQELLWKDFELHWIFVTELKLLLDLFVATSNLRRWDSVRGLVSIAGLFSGLLSVYRVWTYGR